MLKANKKTLIITSIVTILPILAGVFLWNRLPDVMATHFGPEGEANGFSSKAFAVFGMPLFCLAMLWVAAFVTANDPRKQNIGPKMFGLVLWIVPIVSVVAAVMVYPFNLGYNVNVPFIGEVLMSVLFIIIGNYLPKARQNYTIGIKIPWTLANEENWNSTHRLAGYIWIAGGIIMLVLTLCGIMKSGWFVGFIAAMVIVPCLYSYWLHIKRVS